MKNGECSYSVCLFSCSLIIKKNWHSFVIVHSAKIYILCQTSIAHAIRTKLPSSFSRIESKCGNTEEVDCAGALDDLMPEITV